MSKQKTIILVVSLMLALVLIAGAISYFTSNSRRTCNVYTVSDLAMTDYWGDNSTIYGQVRSDKVQTVYLSDTQQVTEVYVTEGQSVQAGDKLLAYDTTLSGLEVSRKELELQQMREELTTAKKKYNTLAGSKVYTVAAQGITDARVFRLSRTDAAPAYRLTLLANTEGADENGVVADYAKCGGSGTSEDPYLYVCSNGIPFGDDFLREIGVLPPQSAEGEEASEGTVEGGEDAGPIYVVFGISEGNRKDGDILQAGGMCFSRKNGEVSFIVFDASDYIGRPFGTEKPTPECDHSYTGAVTAPTCTAKGYITYTCTKCGNHYKGEEIPALGHSYSNGKCIRCGAADPNYKPNNNPGNTGTGSNSGGNTGTGGNSGGNTGTGGNSGSNTGTGGNSGSNTGTGGNSGSNTGTGSNTGGNTGGNSGSNTGTGSNSGSNTGTGGNTGSNTGTTGGNHSTGPSYAEIQAQKAELQQKIKELDLEIRMAEVELKRMKQELSDGIVYADMAGTISTVLDTETAYNTGEPLIKLAGGGGYYLEGSVSELELDMVYVGQQVTVNSWESGSTYTGVVQGISDIPTDAGYYSGSGNTNVSYYPFTVSIDGTANLREYESVEMTLDIEQEVTDTFYLEQPFIMEENGQSYVYVADADGILRKRYITTGVTLWGSSVQILNGLSLEDTIAFPYGKNAKDGAKTQLSTLDELYGW